jgi:HPt (histidine-containing phosphotransfer) domain-containing protein
MRDNSHHIDRESLLDQFAGDVDLLNDIIETFLAHSPALVAELREAVACRDARRVEYAAHSLKGSVANFGKTPAVDAAYCLERMGADARLDEVDTVFAQLQDRLREVELDLQHIAAAA